MSTSIVSSHREWRTRQLQARHRLISVAAGRKHVVAKAQKVCAERRLVFTITNGRSGSGALAAMAAAVPGLHAVHEPEPKFAWLARHAQRNIRLAEDFLIHDKIPAIEASVPRGATYLETHNAFGKGFFEAAFALRLKFDLVLLHRPARSVAHSLHRLGWIPGRSRFGVNFFLDPGGSNLLRLPDWERHSDYQLCLWHALEVEERQAIYGLIAAGNGARVVGIDADRLPVPDYLAERLRLFGIDVDAAAAARMAALGLARHNQQSGPANVDPQCDRDAEARALVDALVPDIDTIGALWKRLRLDI
ncbi:hypothetical protein [Acuticoccus kandeliae]|uniref:hypothetical protein n=1 Tax=Acuticoccus kandeliae TaxID=2073160 RepID=UPI000D3EDAF4|nr:hypothetical protein [Acuticoccus kandeliae]